MNTQRGFVGPNTPRYSDIMDCIRCGLCLPHCPTYSELAVEMDSPRGRLALIKGVADGRLAVDSPGFVKHMYQCLDCRACETACPAGVPFGRLVEAARAQIERGYRRPWRVRLIRWAVLGQLFPFPGRLGALARLVHLYQRLGLRGPLRRLLPSRLAELEALLPPLPDRFFSLGPRVTSGYGLQTATPSLSNRRSRAASGSFSCSAGQRRVAFFAGCVQSLIFAEVNRATVRVLTRNGCQVDVPRGQVCCGALHVHAGDPDGARALARRNLDAFDSDEVPIVVNAAGCGAMLKEYGDLLADDPAYAGRARAFSARVRDVSEFLVALPLERPDGQVRLRVTYQAPCHLIHAQRIAEAPLQLLRAIPGLELVSMAESDRCCGSAGIYNLTQRELSMRLLDRKIAHLAATGAQAVVSGNAGCLLQLRAGVRRAGLEMQVLHPIELLDAAYRRNGSPNQGIRRQ